ncbi:MAG: hypothetical protein FD129_317, partial [bacterium]
MPARGARPGTIRMAALRPAIAVVVAAVVTAVVGVGAWFVPFAQTDYPPRGTVLFPGVAGVALQESLRVNFRPPVGLSYAGARDIMYAQLDNHAGLVTC